MAVILCNLHYFLDVAQVSPNSGSFIIWFLLYRGDDVVIISQFLHVLLAALQALLVEISQWSSLRDRGP